MASKTLSKPFRLTPEQQALSEERKAKRQKMTAPSQQPKQREAGNIVERPWIPIDLPPVDWRDRHQIKVFTWNLLAQYALEGRELFPSSDCLKASQREDMMLNELLTTRADVLCLQEVDRLEKLLPALEKEGYIYHYVAGPGKKHGCLVAFKEHLYVLHSTKTVYYDSEVIRSGGDGSTRCGKSIRTKNIGSLVSLRSKPQGGSAGVIVATTHLFWHPKYTYERARQAAILVREVAQYRTDLGLEHWPCIICGDFNFTPDDPTYSLIVGDPVLPEQRENLLSSYVVHVSVDPTVSGTEEAEPEGGSAESVDPDKVIINARPALTADGLLSLGELQDLFSHLPRLRSVYDVGLRKVSDLKRVQTFGDRQTLGSWRRGRHEPMYTSYTHYWKNTLDYIFVLDPVDRPSVITALLAPHKTSDLDPGLPRKGVSSSDHVSLAAELCWNTIIGI